MNLEESIQSFLVQKNPLNSTSTLEVLARIERYKKADLKRISDKELFNLTLETLPSCNVCYRVIPTGTRLYRLRKIEQGKIYKSINELGYPPAKYVKTRGRFNEKGESILYVSFDEITTFHEVKAKVGEEYALIEYEITSEEGINVTAVGMMEPTEIQGLNETGKVNHKIIEQFLYTEFTKDVGVGSEHLYRISTMLAKNFLDMPNCEGYLYPSVALGRKPNIAIKPEIADEKVKVRSVRNIRVGQILNNGEVEGEILKTSKVIINQVVEYI